MKNASIMNESLTALQYQAIHAACDSVAPTWPLDQSIAVNPYWNMREQPIESVSAKLTALAKIQSLMPASYYRQQFQAGAISVKHLELAAKTLGVDTFNHNLSAVEQTQSELNHWHNISDLLDAERENKVAWRDEITHQISQFCAAYFQYDGPLKSIHAAHKDGLYKTWLGVIQKDKGVAILMGEPKLNHYFKQLTDDSTELFSQAITELGIDDDILENYMFSLLLEVNGWASWIAYQNFHAMHSNSGVNLFDFLAIRLAWELVLWRYHCNKPTEFKRKLDYQWSQEKALMPRVLDQHHQTQEALWVWQTALEIAYQESIVRDLSKQVQRSEKGMDISPELQAVFCIDVRSEIMRRALEKQNGSIQTFGYAGFFGMPIEYAQSTKYLSRPQLPGLIKAPYSVEEDAYNIDVIQGENARTSNRKARFSEWSQQPSSTFSMVESLGLFYGFKLLKSALKLNGEKKGKAEFSAHSVWSLKKGHRPLTLMEKTNLIASALKGIGLTEIFSKTVLIIGHGSEGVNNPHQHGLNCGACGGQSGELNVRVFCQLANDPSIREALLAEGIAIPEKTQFVPALHNTTTDELLILDETELDESVCAWLADAQIATQQERAERLGLNRQDAQLSTKIVQRSQDWSQVRTEWGLANNAAFFIGPRSLTYGINLQGRAFLHEYDWRRDLDADLLNSIMSAPMIVTNWINMQYNASMLDNLKFGSGNKVLHNVVGGNIGVFEGNGGDLRIGLSKQSLHDGETWMHQPLRLSVFIAAPREAIEKIIHANEDIRYLVDNHWLYILQVNEQTKQVHQYGNEGWSLFSL